MNPVDYARLAERCYHDVPTVGNPASASRMHVYPDPSGHGTVHCFRGTDDVLAWMADVHLATSDVWGIGCVHGGFWDALAAILPACLALPRPVAITGHSLGAAMAILYAGVLAMLDHVVPVYAFEPPRLCADGTLAHLLATTKVPFFATRNGNDVVTQVPLGMTLPGPLTHIGTPCLPFDNVQDHGIGQIIKALTPVRALQAVVSGTGDDGTH